MSDLKPCPFCGGEAQEFVRDTVVRGAPKHRLRGIGCNNRECPVRPIVENRRHDITVRWWNRRAE